MAVLYAVQYCECFSLSVRRHHGGDNTSLLKPLGHRTVLSGVSAGGQLSQQALTLKWVPDTSNLQHTASKSEADALGYAYCADQPPHSGGLTVAMQPTMATLAATPVWPSLRSCHRSTLRLPLSSQHQRYAAAVGMHSLQNASTTALMTWTHWRCTSRWSNCCTSKADWRPSRTWLL